MTPPYSGHLFTTDLKNFSDRFPLYGISTVDQPQFDAWIYLFLGMNTSSLIRLWENLIQRYFHLVFALKSSFK